MSDAPTGTAKELVRLLAEDTLQTMREAHQAKRPTASRQIEKPPKQREVA